LGELEVNHNAGARHCNLYRVLMTPAPAAPPHQLHPAPDAGAQEMHPTPAGGAPPPPQEMHPEPSVQPSENRQGTTLLAAQARPDSVETRQVFEAWQAATGKHRAKLDDKRRRVIQRALRTYPLDEVIDAVQGWRNDPWPDRGRHNDLTVLLRDAEHLEKFRDLARAGPPPPVRASPNGNGYSSFDYIREEIAKAQAQEHP
jgi:hypothetical protein